MKFRIEGTFDETTAALDALREVFDIHEVSRFYPSRGESVFGRVYVTAEPRSRVVRAEATRADRHRPVGELEN